MTKTRDTRNDWRIGHPNIIRKSCQLTMDDVVKIIKVFHRAGYPNISKPIKSALFELIKEKHPNLKSNTLSMLLTGKNWIHLKRPWGAKDV